MRKIVSILMVVSLIWMMPLGVGAQNINMDDNDSKLKDLYQLNDKIQADINRAQEMAQKTESEMSANQDQLPMDHYASTPKSYDEPLPVENINTIPTIDDQPASNTDDILNMVIPAADQEKKMDLQFEDVNMEKILHAIEEVSSINIVLDPALKTKTLELHLKKVTIHDALSIMAESYDLAFKKIGDSLFITTKEKVHEDNSTSQLIKLRYIKASEVKYMVNKLVKTINISEANDSIVVVGTPVEINKVQEIVNKLDVPQPQVILEAKIIEINKDALKNLGVQWSQSVNINFQESKRPVSLANVQNATGSALDVYDIARTPLQFEATINMLEQQDLAKVLANPKIVAINNKEAEIFVGDRIPYTVTTITNGVATNDVRFVEPGIRLKITPSIIDKDFVVIQIEPEVSYIYSFIGPNNQYPWVKTRNATANVRIQNNHAFILGGILDKEDQKSLFKVPFLGNLPLIGNLFSYRTHSVTDSELIISVVPVIVNQ